MTDQLISAVKEYAQGGSPVNMLDHMLKGSRDDIESQAAVRYLRSVDKWPLTEGSRFAEALEHLFGFYQGRPEFKNYIGDTGKLVQAAYGYEFPEPVSRPVPSKEPKGFKPLNSDEKGPKKTKRRLPEGVTEIEVEGASGSRVFKGLGGSVDTSQASDRLQKVIDIQRNG